MNFALSDEHEMLRANARAFLHKEVDLSPLLKPGATVETIDYERLWSKVADLGWLALIVPESYGGLGMSCIDLCMIVGEVGRYLAPMPLLGTLAGTWALIRAGSESQKARLLKAVAAGECKLAFAAADVDGRYIEGDAVSAEAGEHGVRLTGIRYYVVDAAAADNIIVAADLQGVRRYFVVERAAPGLTIETVQWRDITRQVCTVRLDSTPAEPLDVPVASAWPWIRDRLYLVLASESSAGLNQVLDDTVDYAKQRIAFGRPIGAYQAIKHALAEMKGQVECASVAVLYAAWALSESHERASIAAAMAQSYASEAYRDAAFRSIQIFGAIGFTWEMRNHLYFKRARANAELFGSPAAQRAEVFAALEREISRAI